MSDLTTNPAAQAARASEYDAQFGDYFALLKPRVMTLVVFTAFVGLLAAPVPVHPFIGFCAILFIAALAGLAAICAPADVIRGGQAAILGLIAGATSTLLLWTFDRFGFDDPLGLVAAHLIGGLLGMIAAGLVSPDTNLLVQLIASASFAALGITIGVCSGLLGWMIGLLWTPDEQPEPPPLPDAAQS